MKPNDNTIPAHYLVSRFMPADYYDQFSCRFVQGAEITPDDLQVSFRTDQPGWVAALLRVRNAMVKPFGLKAGSGSVRDIEDCIRSGGNNGFAAVAARSDEETVLSLDDKHLRAYISVRIEKDGTPCVARALTLVQFKKRLGRVYFFFIRPFHGVIVHRMLKRSVRRRGGVVR